jgi:photosystem II stability/assembly factor-like uncharacterized protein
LSSLSLEACAQVAPYTPVADASAAPTGWTLIPAGTTNLNAVSGLSDSAVWVVGDHGTIGYWNGSQLSFETSGTTVTLRGVYAVDPDHVYAVGDGGTILSRQAGGVWLTVGANITLQVLTGVWADSMRVVAVGSAGTVVLGTVAPGATGMYKLLMNSEAENLFAVTGTANGGQVVAVGALGLYETINGTTVSRVQIPSFSKLLSGATTAGGTAFFVGQQGTVYSSSASGLTPILGCPETALRGVSTTGTGPDVWIAGWEGTICKISGVTATSFPYTDARWFNGIYAASPTSLWVVGASGTLLHGLPVTPAVDGGSPGSTDGAGLEGG